MQLEFLALRCKPPSPDIVSARAGSASRGARAVNVFTTLSAILLISMAPQARAEWSELTVADTHVVSDLSAKQMAVVADDLADYRLAFATMFTSIKLHPRRPTEVFLLSNRSWQQYGPFCSLCDGYAFATDKGMYIVANGGSWSSDTREVLFHELTHEVLRAELPGITPTWLHEGFADFLSTVSREQGKLIVGGPPGGRLESIEALAWLPLAKVLSISESSSEYSEHNTGAAFFAESWLLMHYVQLTNRERLPQMLQLADLANKGIKPEAALNEIFDGNPRAFEAELQAYAHSSSFKRYQLKGDLPPAGALVSTKPLSQLQAETQIFAMLLAVGGTEKSLIPRLIDFAKRTGDKSHGALLLAAAYEMQGAPESAQPLLDANCTDSLAEAQMLVLCGDSYIIRADSSPARAISQRRELLRKARPWYAKAVRLDPKDSYALQSLAATFISTEVGAAEVRKALEAEFRETPNSARVPQLLGRLYSLVDDKEAQRYFERAVLNAQDTDHRKAILDELHTLENRLAKQPAARSN